MCFTYDEMIGRSCLSIIVALDHAQISHDPRILLCKHYVRVAAILKMSSMS